MIARLPPLNSLRAFDAAVRHMSFQKAAEELFVTPAALSYQIRQLEDHLGVRLFHRGNRSVSLTEHGALIAPGIRAAFDRLVQTMRQLENRRQGNVLTISAGPAFTAKWLTPRLYRFMARHPDIDTRIAASIRLSDLETDDIDVAIRYGRGNYPNCYSVKLLDEYVTPLCAPRLLEGPDAIREPADLKHASLIHDETHVGVFYLPDWQDWLDAAGVEGVDPKSSGLHFNVADHAIDAAIAGAGVVLGRMVLAQNDLDAGRLVAPFDLKLKADYSFYAVSLNSRADTPNIVAFREWLLEECAGVADDSTPGPAV